MQLLAGDDEAYVAAPGIKTMGNHSFRGEVGPFQVRPADSPPLDGIRWLAPRTPRFPVGPRLFWHGSGTTLVERVDLTCPTGKGHRCEP